jgi:hypothetical protein
MKHSKHPYPICWLIGPLWVRPQLQELHGMEGRAPEEDERGLTGKWIASWAWIRYKSMGKYGKMLVPS